MGDENKEILRRYWEEIWNEKDLARASAYFTSDFVLHVSGATIPGGEELNAMLASQWFDPFPDLVVRVDLQLAEGDFVAELLTFSGTHTGPPFHPGLLRARGLPPIPTRQLPFEFTQTSIARLVEGKIAEVWEDFDRVRLFLQLGVELAVPS